MRKFLIRMEYLNDFNEYISEFMYDVEGFNVSNYTEEGLN